jgi:hypothetical protein
LQVALHPLLVRQLVDDAALMDMAAASYRAELFGPKATLDMIVAEMRGWSDLQLHSWAGETRCDDWGVGPLRDNYVLIARRLVHASRRHLSAC